VTVASVSFPQPGITRLKGIVVTEPRQRQPLATMECLEIRRDHGTWLAITRQLTLAPGSRDAWSLLYRCATPPPGVSDTGVRLLAEQVVLLDSPQKTLMRQLVVEHPENKMLTISTNLESEETLRLQLAPQADGSVQVEFTAGAAAVPAEIAVLLTLSGAQRQPGEVIRGVLHHTSTIKWTQ
jgi:hypothetical protein